MLSRRRLCLVFFSAVTAVSMTGCQPLHFGGPATAELAPQPDPSVPTFLVEVREGTAQKSRTRQLPLAEPLTVQDVLKKTGVLSQFTRMNITIERPVPGRPAPLKLEIPFSVATRSVDPGRDYAIRPGDRLIIAEDTRTLIDRLFDQAFGMMGPLAEM